jgi:enterochelin esterase-like enzyme
MKTISALLTFLALAGALAAQTPSADAPAKAAPKQKAKKEFSEPKWMMPKVEGPNLHYNTFDSKTVKEKVSYLIYLPPDYETATTRRYPVVYWLHGIGGSQQGVPQMAERLTKAIAEKKTPPMIVVYVNGMIRSGYVDSADGKYPVETVTIKELIPHVDATYRTIATRDGRVIEGFSMGGAGAAKWGFKYPELFGTVSILAGALFNREQMAQKADSMKDTYGSPERFELSNPWTLAEKNADKIRGRTVVRVAVGGKDGLAATNSRFHEHLEKLKIEHDFDIVGDAPHSPNPVYEGLGDKNWEFWRKALARVSERKKS